jgi:2-polyprenyl-3-methyl-5-hydroxy-6-metoxy-1,4-benzoquinol methylase
MSTDGHQPVRLESVDPRPGPWSAAGLRERPCPFCADPGAARFVRPDGLTVRGCERCGGWFVSPAPGPEQLAAFYRDYHRRYRVEAFRGTSHADRARLPAADRPEVLAERIRARDPREDLRVRELASAVPLMGACVLDVGCGTGQLAWLISSMGARVTGVDVDPAAVDFVVQELGIECLHGTIADVPRPQLPEAGYDLVLLQDLIEHVLEPRELLGRATDLLQPGGVLYLWTPNASEAGREPAPRVFRADFEHLQFLSTRTVLRLARELGLEPVHHEAVGFLRTHEGPARGRSLRGLAARLPGLAWVARARAALRERHAERSGSYHLLALLARPR